jgi:exopolysaccharide biosynthesis polyprenyl glycosylphosphotransferase
METRFRRALLLLALKLWECGVAAGAMLAALYLNDNLAESFPSVQLVLGSVLVWHLSFLVYRLYGSRRLESFAREAADVVRATATATAAVGVAAVLLHVQSITLTFLVEYWAIGTVAALVSRAVMRLMLRLARRQGVNLRHAIIVGAGPRGMALYKRFAAHPELGYRVAGFVDNGIADLPADLQQKVPFLGTLHEMPSILVRTVVDEVFLALPMRSFYSEMQSLLRQCEEQGITVVVPGDLFDAHTAKSRVLLLDDMPTIRMHSVPESSWRLVMKRMIDIVVSATLLLLLAPVLLGVALAIKISMPGPVLFKQTRVGLNKRHFTLYKYRTMVVDAEKRLKELEARNEAGGPVFKMKDDPRVTRLGRFLRRTSIDELPQLYNVLIGDMSLVGPRPLPLRDVDGFQEHWHRRRFSVPPGITCLWQLSGRSNITFNQWMELDRQYIDNWSLVLDLKILLRTVFVVLKREGAY